MKTISMLELRKSADAVLRQVQGGQSFVLTYRGKAVARLEPVRERSAGDEDSIYSLDELASDKLEPLTNEIIDWIVYER
jgi:antitoxin (DNA-binding transcriptional repressor) of toxin-antitoxin stability system